MRAAAAIAGVTNSTIRRWIDIGRLPDKPWTAHQILIAASDRRRCGGQAEHGTINSWRSGCSCQECCAANSADHTTRRRHERDRQFPPAIREKVLRAIADGVPMADAAGGVGLSRGVLWGRARRDQEWAAQLDEALLSGRDPRLCHGIGAHYRKGRCECGECRAAHIGTGRRAAAHANHGDDADYT